MLKNEVDYMDLAKLQITSLWCKPAKYKSNCHRDPGESAEQTNWYIPMTPMGSQVLIDHPAVVIRPLSLSEYSAEYIM